MAEAFQAERITASHANLIARLPQERQQPAFEACWREGYQDKETHLLPAKYLSAWIHAPSLWTLTRERPPLSCSFTHAGLRPRGPPEEDGKSEGASFTNLREVRPVTPNSPLESARVKALFVGFR